MKSEFIKLRTLRSILVATFILIAFPVVITVLNAFFFADPSETGMVQSLMAAGFVSMLMSGVLGVFAIAQEYSQGTIRITFASTPLRLKVYVAKALVLSLWVAISAALLEVVGLGVASFALKRRGFDTGVMYKQNPYDSAWQVLFAFCAVCILFALIGFALGALLRNSPGAISTLILAPLLVEGILVGLLSAVFKIDISRKVPFTAALSSVGINPDGSRWSMVGYFGIWCLGLSVLAALFMKRRDA
jgi:ABC-type transport system involved in multi-copper enzyme maturation permease subunit